MERAEDFRQERGDGAEENDAAKKRVAQRSFYRLPPGSDGGFARLTNLAPLACKSPIRV